MPEDDYPDNIGLAIDIAISVINGATIVRVERKDGQYFHSFVKAKTAAQFIEKEIVRLNADSAERDTSVKDEIPIEGDE